MSSIYFLHGSHSFAKLLHDGLVKPVQTAGSTKNISATWSHVSPMLKCNDLTKSWRMFLKLSKVVEIGHWLIEIFYIHLSGCRNYYLSGYDTTVVATSLICDNYMLWDFYSLSSLCYQDEILKTSGIFLSPIFSLVKNLVSKSASTSTAVLIGLKPFSFVANTLATSSFLFSHWPSHEFWDNYSVLLNSFWRLNHNPYCNISVFCLLIQGLMFTILSFCSVLAGDFSCAMLGKFVQCWCSIYNNQLLSKN